MRQPPIFPPEVNPSKIGYSSEELASVPGGVLCYGCGNPTASARLEGGETVLVVGSRGGFDALLAAQRVGEKGRVIGVDNSADMVSRATEIAKGTQAKVAFIQGELDALPLAGGCADVAISNCVINSVQNKLAAFEEVARCLKPGGRVVLTDLVTGKTPPKKVSQEQEEVWDAWLSKALSAGDYLKRMREAGFRDVKCTTSTESPFPTGENDERLRGRIVGITVEARACRFPVGGEWLAAIQRYDEGARFALIDQLQPAIAAAIRFELRRKGKAINVYVVEDLIQETFLAIFKALKPRTYDKAYFKKIAINTVRRKLNSDTTTLGPRRTSSSSGDASETGFSGHSSQTSCGESTTQPSNAKRPSRLRRVELPLDSRGKSDSPSTTAEKRESEAHVRHAMNGLSERQRAVMICRYFGCRYFGPLTREDTALDELSTEHGRVPDVHGQSSDSVEAPCDLARLLDVLASNGGLRQGREAEELRAVVWRAVNALDAGQLARPACPYSRCSYFGPLTLKDTAILLGLTVEEIRYAERTGRDRLGESEALRSWKTG